MNIDLEITKPAPREYESATSLSRYDRCGESYRLRYIEGHKGKSSPVLEFGSLVHLILEKVFKAVIEARLTTISDPLLAALSREAGEESGVDWRSTQDARDLVRAYLTRVEPLNPDKHKAVEVALDFDLNGRPMRAILDRVDLESEDTAVIIDYKTGKDWGSYENQVALYSHAILQTYPQITEVKFFIEFISLGYAKEYTLKVSQLTRHIERLSRLLEKIEAKTFDPTITSACVFCDMKEYCAFAPKRKAKND
jgi:CRISPR/Cas system-associated exonuclease Cas4 (RecB family)